MEKTPAPLDNKNVMDDFIYTDVFSDNFLRTPADKGNTCNIIGYFNDKLLEARWTQGSNRLCMAFISTNENQVDHTSALSELKAYFDNLVASNEGIVGESFISGKWIIYDFYFR